MAALWVGSIDVKIAFITWDGPATSYHESLFIPILEGFAEKNDGTVDFHQISWSDPDRTTRLIRVSSVFGVGFFPYEIVRSMGRIYSLVTAVRAFVLLAVRVKRGRYDIIIGRSGVAGYACRCLCATVARGAKFVYDADGIPSTERVEFAGWRRRGLRFQLLRALETKSVAAADRIIVRTSFAAAYWAIATGRPYDDFVRAVNGRSDLEFRPGSAQERLERRSAIGVVGDAPVAVFVGSVGPQYELPSLLSFALRCLERDSRFVLVVIANKGFRGLLEPLVDTLKGSVRVVNALPTEVPEILRAADVGLALRSPTLSQRFVAPIKVAEYLLSGLPLIYTKGVGDLDSLLGDESFGVSYLDDMSTAAEWFFTSVLTRRSELRLLATNTGRSQFGLDVAIREYGKALLPLFGCLSKDDQDC